MTDLKPCPFCGGEAEVYEMQYGENGKYSVFGVFCKDDSRADLIGLSRYQHGHFIDNFPTEAEAVAAWNARAERMCEIEHVKGGAMYDVWRCSACGYEYAESVSETSIVQNYCPNCGARVIGKEGA